jgi:hypothetical protein
MSLPARTIFPSDLLPDEAHVVQFYTDDDVLLDGLAWKRSSVRSRPGPPTPFKRLFSPLQVLLRDDPVWLRRVRFARLFRRLIEKPSR